MHVLITYDVATTTAKGRGRLRRVAKLCRDWGQRVQASVFECKLDPGRYASLKNELGAIIDPSTDSLRFYNLGKHYHGRVEHIGVDRSADPDGALIV